MKILFSCCFVVIAFASYCQQDTPGFGIFTQDEINYKVCPFDKEADAVIFFDKGMSNFNDEHNLVTVRNIRFKVLREKGIERGDIHIDFYSADNYEYLKDIHAVVLSVDDQNRQTISTLENKSIYTKKLNALYSRTSFALPNVKVGSIIEYTYTSVKDNYGGLRSWYFQSDMPTLMSTYGLYIIPDHEFAYTVKKSRELPIEIKPEKSIGKIEFTMKNIGGLRDEAYMASADDYLQKVVFQLSGYTNYFGNNKTNTTWEQLTRELLDERNFGVQLNKDLSNTDDLKASCDRQPDAYNKMKLIHNYVKANMNWNQITSIESEDGIKNPWEKKKGNSGDINLILINLLKSNGLEVYPILVSEREHGKVDTTYPYYSQFNKVAAYVIANGKNYILDGVDYLTPSNMIPYNFLNTKGFVVDRKKGGFITINDNSRKQKDIINLMTNISSSGMVEGQSTIYHLDYSRIDRIEKYSKDEMNYRNACVKLYPGIKIDSFHVKGLENDSLPLSESFNLTSALNKSGNYLLLNYNLFTGYEKNPFLSENRFSNIDFGCMHSCQLNGVFNLPDNVAIESLPKSTILKTPDNTMSLSRIIEKQDNTIRVMIKIDIQKTEYEAEDYGMVQGFYKQMTDFINEPIVLKSK